MSGHSRSPPPLCRPFVPDVTPYETMKIRMLNGGHATIAYPAGLMAIYSDGVESVLTGYLESPAQ
ncbi:mannitol dehydrogenase family protein [Thiocapsa bogorovii]|uniref:mannitol dehydrogenase family protein n=1 Tax=Thiocapsa bogorovii TaxID=521689 RepID=UPI0038CDACD9